MKYTWLCVTSIVILITFSVELAARKTIFVKSFWPAFFQSLWLWGTWLKIENCDRNKTVSQSKTARFHIVKNMSQPTMILCNTCITLQCLKYLSQLGVSKMSHKSQLINMSHHKISQAKPVSYTHFTVNPKLSHFSGNYPSSLFTLVFIPASFASSRKLPLTWPASKTCFVTFVECVCVWSPTNCDVN